MWARNNLTNAPFFNPQRGASTQAAGLRRKPLYHHVRAQMLQIFRHRCGIRLSTEQCDGRRVPPELHGQWRIADHLQLMQLQQINRQVRNPPPPAAANQPRVTRKPQNEMHAYLNLTGRRAADGIGGTSHVMPPADAAQ